MKTSTFSVEISVEKNGKGKSKQSVWEEGATVDVFVSHFVFPTFPAQLAVSQAGPAAILHGVNQFYRKAP
jgi:hypothetical protein